GGLEILTVSAVIIPAGSAGVGPHVTPFWVLKTWPLNVPAYSVAFSGSRARVVTKGSKSPLIVPSCVHVTPPSVVLNTPDAPPVAALDAAYRAPKVGSAVGPWSIARAVIVPLPVVTALGRFPFTGAHVAPPSTLLYTPPTAA